jgi:hypothetical protein
MKIKKNGKVITLTESDLKRIVKIVLNEQTENVDPVDVEKELSNPNSEKGKKVKILNRLFPNFVGTRQSFKNAKEIFKMELKVITGIKPLDNILLKFAKSLKDKNDKSEAEKDKQSAMLQIKNINIPEGSLNEAIGATAIGIIIFLGGALLLSIYYAYRK